jgi:hypothetical protein
MNQGYNLLDTGVHAFWDEQTESSVIINLQSNLGFYEKQGETLDSGPLLEADAIEIIEAMKVPGTGLGMLILKLGRAFGRAVGAGSDAK